MDEYPIGAITRAVAHSLGRGGLVSRLLLCVLVVSLTLWPGPFAAGATTLPRGFVMSRSAAGLNSPTAMAFAPDGRLFVAEQGGTLRVIRRGAAVARPFLKVNVDSTGERGLLGFAFDPGFRTNHFVYAYYTVPATSTRPAFNRVSRFAANGDVALAGSERLILRLDNLSGATNHNGGALHFGKDGKLYVAVGENANPSNSQTVRNGLGKVLRINKDGTVPTDNPFYRHPNATTKTGKAIWMLGFRNPFSFAVQPGTGRMFVNDVGQDSYEEINDARRGSNFGWPRYEGPENPQNPAYRDPFHYYSHSAGFPEGGCAITGGVFYNPPRNQFPAGYSGDYFYADFCGGWIDRIDPATKARSRFASGVSNPVDLIVGADGSLYFLARGVGSVFRFRFTG